MTTLFDSNSPSSLKKIRIGVDVLPDGRVIERIRYAMDSAGSAGSKPCAQNAGADINVSSFI